MAALIAPSWDELPGAHENEGREATQPIITPWILQLQFLAWRRLAHPFDNKPGIRKGIGQIAQRPSVVTDLLPESFPFLLDQFGAQISGIENA